MNKAYGRNSANIPRRKNDEQEFPSGKGIILCETCGAVHFKKRWYHGLEKIALSEKNDLSVKHGKCPACGMIANKQYEGRITIKNFPADWDKQLEELINGFGKRARDRDPMDRVIEFKKDGNNWTITTTENELTNKLAHKIKTTFGKSKSRTHFAPEPSDVAEVVIEFLA